MLVPTKERIQECHTRLRQRLPTLEQRWLVRDLVNFMVGEMLTKVAGYLEPELVEQGLDGAVVDEISRQVAARMESAWGFQIQEFLRDSRKA